MTEPFRWKNCFADVVSSSYGKTAQSFLDDVASPALATLDAQIAKLQASEDELDAFVASDVQDLRRATTMAFCLSIQSLWELQIRAYLKGCARELKKDELAKRTLKARWDELDDIFRTLRGIALKDFKEHPDLDFLQLLGNACRHGDGPSLEKLSSAHPELWPQFNTPQLPPIDDFWSFPPAQPTIDNIEIPVELLSRFVRAIVSFWEEAEYIYEESIERKHPSLERQLVKKRLERANRMR